MTDAEQRLVAILRGVRPDEIEAQTEALIAAGFRALEIPLNSPDPLESVARAIETAERIAPGECLIGAGTVLTPEEARGVAAAGGRLVVSPNSSPAVIAETKRLGLISLPGVMTPTEALAALAAGADGLKLFPAFLLGPAGLKAIRAVLPPETKCWAVGGVGAPDIADWLAAGAWGFGIGSEIYRPGASAAETGEKAARVMAAWAAATG